MVKRTSRYGAAGDYRAERGTAAHTISGGGNPCQIRRKHDEKTSCTPMTSNVCADIDGAEISGV